MFDIYLIMLAPFKISFYTSIFGAITFIIVRLEIIFLILIKKEH